MFHEWSDILRKHNITRFHKYHPPVKGLAIKSPLPFGSPSSSYQLSPGLSPRLSPAQSSPKMSPRMSPQHKKTGPQKAETKDKNPLPGRIGNFIFLGGGGRINYYLLTWEFRTLKYQYIE